MKGIRFEKNTDCRVRDLGDSSRHARQEIGASNSEQREDQPAAGLALAPSALAQLPLQSKITARHLRARNQEADWRYFEWPNDELVIGGYSIRQLNPTRSAHYRSDSMSAGTLVYVRRVGTRFSQHTARELWQKLSRGGRRSRRLPVGSEWYSVAACTGCGQSCSHRCSVEPGPAPAVAPRCLQGSV